MLLVTNNKPLPRVVKEVKNLEYRMVALSHF